MLNMKSLFSFLPACYSRQHPAVKIAACAGLFCSWLWISSVFVPPLVDRIYWKKAYPEFLNQIIRGQSRHPIEHYRTKWELMSKRITFALGGSLLYLAITAVPAFRRWLSPVFSLVFQASRYPAQIFGLWTEGGDGLLQHIRRWFMQRCPGVEPKNLNMSPRRRLVIGTWIMVFVCLQLAAALLKKECWPFTPNSMYSGRSQNIFSQLEVCGIRGDETQLIAGRDNHFSQRLSSCMKKPERLTTYLQQLQKQYANAHPNDVPFQTIQIRRISWAMTPYGSADDAPVSIECLFATKGTRNSPKSKVASSDLQGDHR
jgi:hypothetical protein